MKLMLKGQSYSIFGIETKIAFTNIMLVANAFVWYYIVLDFLQSALAKIAPNDSVLFLVWCLHFSGLIVSALVGASLAKKIERTPLLILWIILGVITSLALIAVNTSDILPISLLALLFGISLGLGMPTCMRYYIDCISVEKRGRVGGIVILAFGIGASALSVVTLSDALIFGSILAVWRLSSLVIFLLLKSSNETKQKIGVSYRLIFSQQSFILYFIPWIMFSLVNYLSTPLQSSLVGANLAGSLIMVQNGLTGVFAVLGGYLLDYIGRKRVAIAGFVMFGLGTAVVGIYPESIFSVYFSVIVDGIAWGIFFVLFVLTIWGDLSYGAPSDKYYAIGVLPFFVSKFLELTVGGYIAAMVPAYALFSFTAFFLFLAVLPLVYAPETLPEKHIKERELKSYIEKAKKEKEKYA